MTRRHRNTTSSGWIRGAAGALLFFSLGFVAACDGVSPTNPVENRPVDEPVAGTSAADDGDAAAFPNEPTGFSMITERAFAADDENGWSANGDIRIVEDESAPHSPGTVGRALFPAGWEGGRAPIFSEKRIGSAGAKRLYVSFWLKVSENWQGHPVNDKLMYFWTHEKPVVFPVYVGGGSNPLGTEVRIQDVPDGGRNLEPNRADPQIHRDRWHRWEVLVVSNTGDAADGEVHWWIDGEKVGEYRDVRFGRSNQAKVWDYMSWRPVWGGAGSTVRQDQHMYMDHVYASGSE